MGKNSGGGMRTGFQVAGGAAGPRNMDFGADIPQRERRRQAIATGIQRGNTTIQRIGSNTLGDDTTRQGQALGRALPIRATVRVVGAGNVRPTTVAAHQFRVGNNTVSFAPRQYNEARRAAINEARRQGVDRIQYLGGAAFGGIQGRDGQFRGAMEATPAGRTRRRR